MRKTPIEIYNLRASQPDFCCLEDMSEDLIHAILLAEDGGFYKHRGISYSAIKNAIVDYLKGKRLVGASTITQQLIKNLYFSFEESYIRKLKESVLAKKFERKLTKKQILELYLNVIYYNNGQYGICNASRFYFGKPPKDLTLNQAFILSYTLSFTGTANPLYHPKEFLAYRKKKILFLIQEGTLPESFLSEIEKYTDDFLDEEICSATKETDKYNKKGPHINERFGPGMPESLIKEVYISTAGYINQYTKNNIDLVTWAKNACSNGWGYVYGTYGLVLTRSNYNAKIEQYPEEIGKYADFIESHWVGGRTADCAGLIKGYGWFNPYTHQLVYNTNGMPDINADTMYARATEKGTIDTIPEIPGLAIWTKGHIGIYIGNGQVIHASGTKKGVIQTPIKNRKWTHWLKIPYIKYL